MKIAKYSFVGLNEIYQDQYNWLRSLAWFPFYN